MAFVSDLRILFNLAFRRGSGATHAERLERFYRGQAEGYDDFRERLLQGRRELIASLPAEPGAVWADMGGGTGANLEFMGDRLKNFSRVYVADLCPSLLRVARERIARNGWTNVEAVEADALEFAPPEGALDLVTFSYSLTMIPDWFAAIDRARELLKPGGVVGVADFYVSRKHPAPGRARHGWATRTFWPAWFAMDDVFLDAERVEYLHARFRVERFEERLAKVPWLPGARVPRYEFVGREATEAHP